MSGIAFNEDSGHYFGTRAGQNLDARKVESWVDQYADTQVTEMMLNPNAMRTSYASKVWDPIWRGYDPDAGDDQPLLAGTPPRGAKWREEMDPHGVAAVQGRHRCLSIVDRSLPQAEHLALDFDANERRSLCG